GATLGIVWGRRRVGKSFLLQSLVEQTGGLYYTAVRGSSAEALRELGELVGEYQGESPWVCRRLQPLRDWGHETGKEVLPRGAGAGGSDGVRARERVLLAVGCHPVYCRKDRLLW